MILKSAFERFLNAVPLILLCLSLSACILWESRCKQLNRPPDAPVYPGAELVNSASSGIGRSRPIVTHYYESTDSPEKIIAFYDEKGTCDVGDNIESRELCHGDATPFGEYFVFVDLNPTIEGKAIFVIEIRWHGCSDRLE